MKTITIFLIFLLSFKLNFSQSLHKIYYDKYEGQLPLYKKPVKDLRLLKFVNENLNYFKNSYKNNKAYIYRPSVNNNVYCWPDDLIMPDSLYDIRIDNYEYIMEQNILPDTATEEKLWFLILDILDFYTKVELTRDGMDFSMINDSVVYQLFLETLKHEHCKLVSYIIPYIEKYAKRRWIKENSKLMIEIMRNNKSITIFDTLNLYPLLELHKSIKDSLLNNPEIVKYYTYQKAYHKLARLGDIYYEAKLIREFNELINNPKPHRTEIELKEYCYKMHYIGSKKCILALIKALDVNTNYYYIRTLRYHVLMTLYRIFPDESLFNREFREILGYGLNSYEKFDFEKLNQVYYEKVRNWAYKNYGIKLLPLPYNYIIFPSYPKLR